MCCDELMNRFLHQLVVGMVCFSALSANSRLVPLSLIIGLVPTIDADDDEFEVPEHRALFESLWFSKLTSSSNKLLDVIE